MGSEHGHFFPMLAAELTEGTKEVSSVSRIHHLRAARKDKPGNGSKQGGLASIGVAHNAHISHHSEHELQSHFLPGGPRCLCLPVHIFYNVL